ncbi:MAG TPA: penicillin-binding protein 2 [bacterium]
MAEALKRFRLVRFALFFFFGLILVFSIRLQVIDGRKYYRLSEENRIKKKFVPAPRGIIYDREGRVIANSRPGFYVSVIPALVDDQSLSALARILKIELTAIKDKMAMEKNPYISVKIAHDIEFGQLSIIEELHENLTGVEVGVEPVRNYPYKAALAHLIGYVGEATSKELRSTDDYIIGDYIGRMGIEAQYESKLKGTNGIEYIEVDARGREVGDVLDKRPVPVIPGNDLYTTIDLALTESTATYLSDYERAAAVVIVPSTGEVLVLYSKPGFDPNGFIHGLRYDEWQLLYNSPDACMYNRAIMSCYPPGSTFKPFVALSALDAGMVTENRYFESCAGSYRLGNRRFGCWKKHGRLPLVDAIIQSCDVYFYQLGRFTGVDTIASRSAAAGFGKKTGIDLPQEKAGIMPDRAWFVSRYTKYWTEGHVLNLSIGQGDLLVTPLQLACSYLVFANDGTIPIPHLVLGAKSMFRKTGLSREAIEVVKKGLFGVVAAGTGVLARVENIEVGGKTGTAENPHGDDHSLFVGYAPVEHPDILVCIVVENAGHGGSVAAPIAGRIMKVYFANKDSVHGSN